MMLGSRVPMMMVYLLIVSSLCLTCLASQTHNAMAQLDQSATLLDIPRDFELGMRNLYEKKEYQSNDHYKQTPHDDDYYNYYVSGLVNTVLQDTISVVLFSVRLMNMFSLIYFFSAPPFPSVNSITMITSITPKVKEKECP